MDEVPAPTLERVFGLFGRASFSAHALEMRLLAVHALVSAMELQRGDTKWTLDRLSKAQLTCGQVFGEIRKRHKVSADLDEKLRKFIDLRNHLIHGFYRSYGLKILSESGRGEMIAELAHIAAFLDLSLQLVEVLQAQILHEMRWPREEFDQEFRAWVETHLPPDTDVLHESFRKPNPNPA